MRFYVMDRSGHATIEFTAEQKRESADLFNQLVRERGLLPATRKQGEQTYTVIRSPDQLQDETLFSQQLKGG